MTTEEAVLGGGCFWCLEAVYQRVDGVLKVESGYAGGQTVQPTYEEVCSGATGHAEVVRVVYDPARVTFEDLLDLFWQAHDPTTMNRQGNDIGTQYRSIILWSDERQRDRAERSRRQAQAKFREPIVTTLEPLGRFFPAEAYHQNYYNTHQRQPYCFLVISPKLAKLGMDGGRG